MTTRTEVYEDSGWGTYYRESPLGVAADELELNEAVPIRFEPYDPKALSEVHDGEVFSKDSDVVDHFATRVREGAKRFASQEAGLPMPRWSINWREVAEWLLWTAVSVALVLMIIL